MTGTFSLGEKKIRPGAYYSIQTSDGREQSGAIDGITAVLFRSDWGPLGEAIELNADTSYEMVFGTAKTTDAIALAREGGASTIIACRIGNGGTQGKVKLKLADGSTEAITLSTKYVGSKEFAVSFKDKLADNTKRECIIYTGTQEFEKVTITKGSDEVSALVDAFSNSDNFIVEKIVSASGELEVVSQEKFTVGTDPVSTIADYVNGFTAIESYFFNTVCVDTEDVSVLNMLKSFLDRISEEGQLGIGVVAEKGNVDFETKMNNATMYNSEKVVYVVNPDLVSSTYGEITGYQTAAKIAGMIASCPSNQSLTHTVLDKVTKLNNVLTPTQMTKAQTMGCLTLSVNAHKQIWIDNAINTLVLPADNQDNGWKKIRRTKTRYELITRADNQADELIGKIDNDKNGRAYLISQIRAIGTAMIEEGKLVSFDVTESDAYAPEGDSAWFEIDCVDRDSAEHIYLTYNFKFNTQE